jgi:4-hydroxy-2-oxoheptanedioate aldolase
MQMAAPENTFKRALQAGRAQIGLWQTLASTTAAEICAGAGFDWLLFDSEHTPTHLPLLVHQLQAVAGQAVHPVARVPVGETALIKQYLDIGFQTLLVPLVETAEQAAQLVKAVRYPPRGVRGVAVATRAARWGRADNYAATADAQICLLVQVETRKGLDNLDAIARTEGIDGVFIGPGDLSAALGHLGNPTHPEVLAAIEAALLAIRACGTPAGTLATDPALAERYLNLGCTFVAVGLDSMILAKATSDLAQRFKQP